MVINVSRLKTFRLCRHKALNIYHRKVEGPRSMNLVDGGAFHDGVAAGRATKDWVKAQDVALSKFEEDVALSTIPPEQEYQIQEHRSLVIKMLRAFEEQYQHEVYQIIQPECQGVVELPESGHNCIWMHSLIGGHSFWGEPPVSEIIANHVRTPHPTPDPGCQCWQPHRFAFRTDAIVSWNHNIWLDEYKTTAISGDQFWDQWQLDIQPTAYIYGIWRLLGVRPRGFLLNAINKPSEAQVANWNSKRKSGPDKSAADYIKLDREGFFRSEDDLLRVERQLTQVCWEWEREIMDPNMVDRFGMTPMSHSCKNYNRKCDFFSACQNHDLASEFDHMQKREADYVDIALEEISGHKRGA